MLTEEQLNFYHTEGYLHLRNTLPPDLLQLTEYVLQRWVGSLIEQCVSDARMSGTAFGTVVLHTAPEAAAGGTLALVQDGDMIELDIPKRSLILTSRSAVQRSSHRRVRSRNRTLDRLVSRGGHAAR